MKSYVTDLEDDFLFEVGTELEVDLDLEFELYDVGDFHFVLSAYGEKIKMPDKMEKYVKKCIEKEDLHFRIFITNTRKKIITVGIFRDDSWDM